MKYILILFVLFLSLQAKSQNLEKVTLQLQWLDQFQFAGYYMAKEKGFYKDVGLDVTLKKYAFGVNSLDDVLAGKSTFGIGRSSLIAASSSGKRVALLAAIYQSSPLVLIALKSSGINTIKDFEGKKLMMTKDAIETASIDAMITSSRIDESEIRYVEHSFSLEKLINSEIDLYAGYISNEPYKLQELGIAYKLFYPAEYGFDFYEDILFTTQKEIEEHPQRVKDFKEASLQGWKYAFDHIEESVDFIYKNYNVQNKSKAALLSEAKELKRLAYWNVTSIGEIDKNKIQRIYDVYRLMGLTKLPLNLNELIYTESFLTKKEKEYLLQKKEIRICVQPHSKPYSAIEDGKYVGVGEQILEYTQTKFDIRYKLIDTSSWQESLKKGSNKECDLLPIASKTPKREYFFNFTSVYHSEPLVIITKKETNYVIDFKTVLDKTFSIVKGHSFIAELKSKYPQIKLKFVERTEDGLIGVKQGLYFGHIDVLLGAAYGIKMIGDNTLQVSGQFDEKVHVSFGVRKDDPILLGIFEKVARSLQPADIQKILNEWVQINYTKKVNYEYLYETFAVLFVLLSFFLFKHYVLNKKNIKLEQLQSEILEINKNLEIKIEAAVSDLEKAQEVAKVGSWILDIQKQQLKWSKETYRMFEVDRSVKKELFNAFLERIHPDDRDAVKEAYALSLEKKSDYKIEHRLRMNDGTCKYVLEKCQTTFSEDGVALISYGTVQDITESTLIKEELKKKDTFMLQQSRLAQMGEMLSMIAHQWKQPLSAISATGISIQTSLSLEKYNLDNKKEREEFVAFLLERLDKVAVYVQNLSQTINNFSSFYKPNKESKSLDVDSVVKKAYTLLEDSLRADEIAISFDLASSYKINMHENEFMQVILNMINNARDQLQANQIKNPSIRVKTHEDAETIYICIEDNAGGIDEEIIEEIFDPYFSTKLEKNGTGLGLYMSKVIVEDYHHGKIYAGNSIEGALFKIELNKMGGV